MDSNISDIAATSTLSSKEKNKEKDDSLYAESTGGQVLGQNYGGQYGQGAPLPTGYPAETVPGVSPTGKPVLWSSTSSGTQGGLLRSALPIPGFKAEPVLQPSLTPVRPPSREDGGGNTPSSTARSVSDTGTFNVEMLADTSAPGSFRGVASMVLGVTDYVGDIANLPVNIDVAENYLRKLAEDLGVTFRDLFTQLLLFTIYNGTSPFIDHNLSLTVPCVVSGTRYIKKFKFGDFMTALGFKFPNVTLRQFMRNFADNARELLRSNQAIVPPGFRTALGKDKAGYISKNYRVISFDYADYCTGLTTAEMSYIQFVKVTSLGGEMQSVPIVGPDEFGSK